MGNDAEAIMAFEKAIAVNPNFGEAYYNLSVIYFQEKRYRLAIEYCDKARALGFSNPDLSKALEPYREKGAY
jgi:tetratricopeptide (TPR) repeat protein